MLKRQFCTYSEPRLHARLARVPPRYLQGGCRHRRVVCSSPTRDTVTVVAAARFIHSDSDRQLYQDDPFSHFLFLVRLASRRTTAVAPAFDGADVVATVADAVLAADLAADVADGGAGAGAAADGVAVAADVADVADGAAIVTDVAVAVDVVPAVAGAADVADCADGAAAVTGIAADVPDVAGSVDADVADAADGADGAAVVTDVAATVV
eukprot:GHVU01205920.1.p1 GENE.GHVU01205920.1~~GHVU01205920.1.p1  ORF type:complete len:210 (-),score=39.84 GHVU01205920.1:1759-2388(-)